ncbi:MAG: DUF2147 domain-containing protein [Porphyromonadaceae bacterium]|nr:DUF2147 domain-containing protein [Porphyromonadaceae bacterium]
MKRWIALALVTLLTVQLAWGQQAADRLIGTYYTAGAKGKVRISKQGNKYNGVLIWIKTPGALDSKNPDAAQRSKPLAGKLILTNFVYDGDDVWEDGKIYDPESGKTYSCKITRLSNGNLKVRGFIGVSLIGRTTEWTRLSE